MESAITDDMKPQTMTLRHSPRRYGFPRYGNFYSHFSTLWKIFFHSMENVGRATARTRRGRCCYQEPSPRIGDKMHNKALLGTTHKLPNSNGLSSLQSSIVLPVGRPQNADVVLIYIEKANGLG